MPPLMSPRAMFFTSLLLLALGGVLGVIARALYAQRSAPGELGGLLRSLPLEALSVFSWLQLLAHITGACLLAVSIGVRYLQASAPRE